MTFAKEAWPFALPLAVLALALLAAGWKRSAALVAIAAILVLLFFRIPRRSIGHAAEPEVVLAPANGVITRIDTHTDPALGEGEYHRIVTFLSVFDVHVQRAPVAGEVIASTYRRGKKIAAFRAAAGEVNEHHFHVLRRPNGDLVGVRQIAGLVARRVVSYVSAGAALERGELLGIIKFGSRVDLYIPKSYTLLVQKNRRVKEGLTGVARAPSSDPIAVP